MTQEKLYKYLGTNGTILSPVHLPDIYHIVYWKLAADIGKTLVKDGIKYGSSQIVPDEELSEWTEL